MSSSLPLPFLSSPSLLRSTLLPALNLPSPFPFYFSPILLPFLLLFSFPTSYVLLFLPFYLHQFSVSLSYLRFTRLPSLSLVCLPSPIFFLQSFFPFFFCSFALHLISSVAPFLSTSLFLPYSLLSSRWFSSSPISPLSCPSIHFPLTCNFLPSSSLNIFLLFLLFYWPSLLPLFSSFTSLTSNSLLFISLLLMTSGESSPLRDATGEQPWKAIPLRWLGHPRAMKGSSSVLPSSRPLCRPDESGRCIGNTTS